MNLLIRYLSDIPYLEASGEVLHIDMGHFLDWCGIPSTPPNHLAIARAVKVALEELADRVTCNIRLHAPADGEEVAF